MELVFESSAYFRFLDYHVSHKQLLIRGEDAIENDNIDLAFEGTFFLSCPTTFNGIKIYLLDHDSSKEKGLPVSVVKNFLIESENNQYFIQAGALRIFRNSLPLVESSIDITGKGQEHLLWMSK